MRYQINTRFEAASALSTAALLSTVAGYYYLAPFYSSCFGEEATAENCTTIDNFLNIVFVSATTCIDLMAVHALCHYISDHAD